MSVLSILSLLLAWSLSLSLNRLPAAAVSTLFGGCKSQCGITHTHRESTLERETRRRSSWSVVVVVGAKVDQTAAVASADHFWAIGAANCINGGNSSS